MNEHHKELEKALKEFLKQVDNIFYFSKVRDWLTQKINNRLK